MAVQAFATPYLPRRVKAACIYEGSIRVGDATSAQGAVKRMLYPCSLNYRYGESVTRNVLYAVAYFAQ